MTATTATINREAIRQLAKQCISRKLSGELPENDATTWSKRAAAGMNVFRDAIRDCVRSMDEGRISAESAAEIIDICKSGIDAFMDLDE